MLCLAVPRTFCLQHAIFRVIVVLAGRGRDASKSEGTEEHLSPITLLYLAAIPTRLAQIPVGPGRSIPLLGPNHQVSS